MFTTAAQRFRDARRLILFATLMAFTAGVVTYLRYDMTVGILPLPLYTGLVYAVLIGAAATISSIVLPVLGAFIEATAISRLGVALAAYGSPDFGLALQQSPFLSATAVVGGAILIRKATAHPSAQGWAFLGHLPSRRIL
ncbi:hypothetical protein [Defluviimonas sp. SAOS-178_SWC]|uniref:hypothetical protein n=1 Tax=Defluviimonas sp. SAOS-178_SWC TaxID=3121287 RepID=UPI003221E6D0